MSHKNTAALNPAISWFPRISNLSLPRLASNLFLLPACMGLRTWTATPNCTNRLQRKGSSSISTLQWALHHSSIPTLGFPALCFMLWAAGECAEVELFKHLRGLDQLDVDVHGFSNQWWSILVGRLPKLQRLANTDYYISINFHPVADFDAEPHVKKDSGPHTVVLESDRDGALSQTGGASDRDTSAAAQSPTRIPDLKHLSFTMSGYCCTFRYAQFPNLYQFDLTVDHSCSLFSITSVSHNLESLHITSNQCLCQVTCALDSIPVRCKVKYSPPATGDETDIRCTVGDFRMRFAGDANRHVWRTLLGGGAFFGCGMVNDRIIIELDQSMVVTVVDARLIARVLAHLLSRQQDEMFPIVFRCGEDAIAGKQMLGKLAQEIQGQAIKCRIVTQSW